MAIIEEDFDMDIVWLLTGAAFFVASCGLVRFFGSLQEED
jgi:hypothetical protein